MTREGMVHVAFRSTETGRFLFHAWWPESCVRKMETAAAVLGVSVDQLLHDAIEAYTRRPHDPTPS